MTDEENKKRIEALEAELAKANEEKKAALGEKFKAGAALKEAQDERDAAAERAEREAKDVEALEKRLSAKFQKQIDDATSRADKAEGELRSSRVDGAIANLIAQNGVIPELHEAVEALLHRKVEYVDGAATIEGQSIEDYGKGFFGSKSGAHYVRAADNSGGGSLGNSGASPTGHTFTKENFGQRMTEWSMLGKSNPELAKSIAMQVGRSDLADSV